MSRRASLETFAWLGRCSSSSGWRGGPSATSSGTSCYTLAVKFRISLWHKFRFPAHFREVWANSAARCEAPSIQMMPRLPVNEWGTCFSHAQASQVSRLSHTKKRGRIACLPSSVSLIFAKIEETERGRHWMPTPFFRKSGSPWTARRLISQSGLVINAARTWLREYWVPSSGARQCVLNRKHLPASAVKREGGPVACCSTCRRAYSKANFGREKPLCIAGHHLKTMSQCKAPLSEKTPMVRWSDAGQVNRTVAAASATICNPIVSGRQKLRRNCEQPSDKLSQGRTPHFRIWLVRGADVCKEHSDLFWRAMAGLICPMPPNWGGRASSFLTLFPGAARPVKGVSFLEACPPDSGITLQYALFF